MNSPVLKFVVYAAVVTVFCAVAPGIWAGQTGLPIQLKSGYSLLAIFAVSTTVIHLLLLFSAKGSAQGFIRYFMAATMGKFLLYLSVLIGFLMFSYEDKKTLALHFLFYYAVFTIFEVTMLYSEVRKVKQGPEKPYL